MPLVQRARLFLGCYYYPPWVPSIHKIVIWFPTPEFNHSCRTDDPERRTSSMTIRADAIAGLHYDSDSIDHLHISHRNGFNLHPISKGPRCFVAGRQDRLDRAAGVEVHGKIQPMDPGVDDIPSRRLNLDQF